MSSVEGTKMLFIICGRNESYTGANLLSTLRRLLIHKGFKVSVSNRHVNIFDYLHIIGTIKIQEHFSHDNI
jgi:hypothetical protein